MIYHMTLLGHHFAHVYCNKCQELIQILTGIKGEFPPHGYHLCPNCTKAEAILEVKQKDLITEEVKEIMEEKAKRENISVRYDLLVPEFLEEMARLASHGAEKYGDRNWQASRLVGEKSPLNHLYQHLNQFQSGKDHDFFLEKRGHLVSVAFNAMMEWWYEENDIPE